MNNSFQSTKFITGLRGWSALAVLLIHSGGGGLRQMSSITDNIVNSGKYGVLFFYLISAFTICMSIERNWSGISHFFIKRCFRILPMYYLVCVICFILGGVPYYLELFDIQNDIYSLFLHITFLNYFDVRYINNLIGVEWSIPIEFIFYAIIPFLWFSLKRVKYLSIPLLLVSAISSIFGSLLLIKFGIYSDEFFSFRKLWSIENYALIFMLGILCHFYFDELKHLSSKSPSLLLFSIFISFCYVSFIEKHSHIILSLLFTLIFVACMPRFKFCRLLFENKLIFKTGEISFSLYLVHYPIFSLLKSFIQNESLFLFVGLSISWLVSNFAFTFIEKPMINFSKKITGNSVFKNPKMD